MTTPADDSAVEDAFEVYLAGRPVPEEAADLAVFAEAVRATATQPGRPNAALAELLATGLLTDQSSPSVRTARSAGAPPSRGTRTRNRRRFAMLFPALLAKILSAGAIAQAATGAGIAVVVIGGAGAAGALPDPVQDTVATVVETVTPIDVPSSDDEVLPEDTPAGPVADEVADEVVDPAVPVEDPAADGTFDAGTWALGPEAEGSDYASFGAWVSDGAHHRAFKGGELFGPDGLRFSEIVRLWAHDKGIDDDELASELESEGVELEDPADGITEVAPEPETAGSAETADSTSDRGNGNGKNSDRGNDRGNGNGNGNGKGNGRN